jgi:Zn-finger nucleic acid-binding protein
MSSSYNKSILCPNDNIEMRSVQIQSHYGSPIFLEQCKTCGGIWFDQSELYRAKQGEAEKIESLDSEILRASSTFESSTYICPRDQVILFQFNDKYFPQSVVVERCPRCNGFWLNRGEFTKYQRAREELLRPKEKSPEDIKLEENIKQLLEQHNSGGSDDVLGKLGKFLSTPLDERTLLPLENTRRSHEEESALNTILNILIPLLNIFVLR